MKLVLVGALVALVIALLGTRAFYAEWVVGAT